MYRSISHRCMSSQQTHVLSITTDRYSSSSKEQLSRLTGHLAPVDLNDGMCLHLMLNCDFPSLLSKHVEWKGGVSVRLEPKTRRRVPPN